MTSVQSNIQTLVSTQQSRPIDDSVSSIAKKIKPQIEQRLAKSLSTYEPKQVRTQECQSGFYRLYGTVKYLYWK